MARTEARIFASIWKDPAFRALNPDAQRMYLFLLSQADLSYCGVISLRENRWARASAGLTTDDVTAALKALSEGFDEPFLVVDEDTEEVLIRLFIRNDRLWKQPNLIKAAREAAGLVESPAILAALLADLYRIPLAESSSGLVKTLMGDFIAELEKGSGNPSANPSSKGSDDPSLDPSQEIGGGNGSSEQGLLAPDSELLAPVSAPRRPAKPDRPDVERVCVHLADLIEANGSKRPDITQGWRDAARLMIDKDGRTEEQVLKAIDWCQDDDFWHRNVLSMPKLREKYEQLRLAAKPSKQQSRPTNKHHESDAGTELAKAFL